MKHLILALCLVLLAVSQVSAHTWYVSKNGTGDATTIPQGIDMASYGDTVLVGPGTYTESTTRYGGWTSLVFMKGGVTLMSESGPENTVLDAAEASGSVSWAGDDEAGGMASPGIYFVRIEAGDFRAVRKMLLAR